MADEVSSLSGFNSYGSESNTETSTFQRDSSTGTAVQDRPVQPAEQVEQDPLDIWAEGGDPEAPQTPAPQAEAPPAPTAEQAWQQLGQVPYQPPAAPVVPQMDQLQARLQELQLAQAMEQQLVQAHAQYLPPEEAQALYLRHQQASLQRAAEAQQLQMLTQQAQVHMERAALEAPAKTLVTEWLAQEVSKSDPNIDSNALKEFIADAESPQEMMRSVERFIRMSRSANLQARAQAGTDKVGDSKQGGTALAGKSVMELLTLGFNLNERNGSSKRYRSFT